jgi:hypothetical protein
MGRNGSRQRPVSDDDLTVYIESLGAELDLDADLANNKEWHQAYTEFLPGRPPIVRVSRVLAQDIRFRNRYRFTLGHEAGHVLALHEASEREGNMLRGDSVWRSSCSESSSRRIEHDWLEFQADYCGAVLLMPRWDLEVFIGPRPEPHSGMRHPVRSAAGQTMITEVANHFLTSRDAAKVRLTQTGYLYTPTAVPQLRLPFRSEQ